MTGRPPLAPGQVGRFGGALPQPQPIVDTRNSSQGGQRRKTRSEVLITNTLAGPYGSDTAALFRVQIPSTRLLTVVSLHYVADSAEDVVFTNNGAGSILGSMDAWTELESGLVRRANNIFTNRPIPTSWEAVTGVRQWRGQATVVPENEGLSGTGFPPGRLWVSATWEPAPGEDFPPDELAAIFRSCNVEATHGLTTSQNGGP